jgi:hypothetical protein
MNIGEKQDELIFDFLEGNLTPGEEEAFLILKEESEVLGREVRLWQNTFLKEPLPSIDALEKKLFIHEDLQKGNLRTRIYALVMIVLTYIIAPVDMRDHVNPVPVNPSADVSPATANATPQALTPAVDPHEREINVRRAFAPASLPDLTPAKDQAPADELRQTFATNTAVLLLQPAEIEIRSNAQIEPQGSKPDSVIRRKEWSKHEQRMIRKKLRRDDRVRKINEFRSGNEPYVVPLNSNNF